MQIAIVGYGKMGKMVEESAQARGHTVGAIIKSLHEITPKALENIDVCIDFTQPDSAVKNIEKIAGLKKNLVVGTTGWYDHLPHVQNTVQNSGIGMLYGSNFSIGHQIFLRLVAKAIKMLDPFPEFDIGGFEAHHQFKKDSPAGSCYTLEKLIKANSTRKKKVIFNPIQGSKKPDEVHITSLRCGYIPGQYEVMFDAPEGSIKIAHQARSRIGYAEGAVLAAEWVHNKKGIYHVDTLIDSLLERTYGV
jgi:4-hydroxy-tetrahydrodipicolinate reductase